MFEAYTPAEIATKLEKSVDVISLAANDHAARVYVGSKAGYLLSLNATRGAKRGYDLVMCRSFEKKAVSSLCVVARHDLLLCLCDAQLCVHNLSQPFALKAIISDVRPINTFCWTINDIDGLLYIAVSARKKIFLYKWLVDDFLKVAFEISPAFFPDSVHYLKWFGPIISLTVQNDYYYVAAFSNNEDSTIAKRLFDVGSKTDNPIVVGLPDRKLIAYCRDGFIFFQQYYGTINPVSELKFSEPPLDIVYDSPYLVALLSKGKVEVRSVYPATHIQTIQLNKALFISAGLRGTIYALGISNVWLLDSHQQMKSNVERLVHEKQFELAIQLAEKCNEIGDEGVVEIKRVAAFNFFCQRKFDRWLELHDQIKTDVMTVIAHFPRLLDLNYRETLKSLLEEEPPDLPENEYRSGLQSLAPYLASVRMGHAKAVSDLKKRAKLGKSAAIELKNHENVLQVVDTTLLKCYLQTNESLVTPLLRLPDNMCILSVAEKILIERQKFYELYLLYQKRALHEKALSLLKEHAHSEIQQLKGYEITINYLQQLDNDNLHLIFEFAPWVLLENFCAGLKIFVNNNESSRSLDREKVLRFLKQECGLAVIPYLEHIIFNWSEARRQFHDALGEHYISKVKQLIKEYYKCLRDDLNVLRAGEEDGELGEFRRKLINFLKTSNKYSPEKLLVQLRHDSLYEERALLLGKLKRHKQALAIYTQILKDYQAAENYCAQYFDRDDPEHSKVYLLLVEMYTNPSDASILGPLQSDMYEPESNPAEAIKLLANHAEAFDPVDAVSSLPLHYALKTVWPGLATLLQATHDRKTTTLLHKSVCDSAFLTSVRERVKSQSLKFTIDYTSECAACGKRISNSAFARYPNGRIEHFYCYQTKE